MGQTGRVGHQRDGRRPVAASGALSARRRAQVLIVEDDAELLELLLRTFKAAGFDARGAPGCAVARVALRESPPELAVLDVMLPDGSGLDLLQEARELVPGLGVVLLTARDGVQDRLTGFAYGADDYLTKPFSVAELIARANALLRRMESGPDAAVLRLADLELDEDAHLVRRAGRTIDLSPTEYRLLRHLLENAGRVQTRAQLTRAVWDYDFVGDGGVVEKFVSQLRRKIDDPDRPLLHTVRGFGYVLRDATG